MENTIRIQVYIFLTALYGGLIAGLFYDIYRINRHYFKPKNIVAIIEDFIFWIGVALIFFYILNKNDWIELRAYVFIGFFAGGIIYLKVISKMVFTLLVKILDGITAIIKRCINLLIFPLRYLRRKVSIRLKRVGRLKKMFKESIGNIRRYTSIILRKK
ncbi:MAG: spore cortex biosynthesis protein YabQ [Tissierellia bacterium]|nr:spore cortex biosynthesis protein YabQ [Tissierellia bacterium]